MPWEYSQSTGDLKFNGVKVIRGYAGKGNAKNQPTMEHLGNFGPIPKGKYEIQAPRTSARTGPYVLPLVPIGHNARGRADFQIHGDSRSNPGSVASGCIVVRRSVRERIWKSGIRNLIVVH